jgi:hypothetical protein
LGVFGLSATDAGSYLGGVDTPYLEAADTSTGSRQLYLVDTPTGYLHVFDVGGLRRSAPRDIADIKLAHPTALPPLQTTTESVEIDWRGGRPVAATSRYGVGYP